MPEKVDLEESVRALHAVVESMDGTAREGQETMAHAVYETLIDNAHLLVQAGTGTGKSFGYLVPALLWAAKTGHRVIVSTATLALQRQIMTSDAPKVVEAIGKITGVHPKVALLKGWNNYVCLRKANGGYPEEGALLSRAEGEMGATATGEEVVRARDWAMVTQTGDRDDLVPGVHDRVWAQVSIPKAECIGEKCPLRASCFPVLARAAADEADVVVTNHAMLGVAATKTPVLPETDAYIVDEAHDLVDRVTNQLTRSLTKGDVGGVIRMLRTAKILPGPLEDIADDLGGVLEALGEERLTAIPPQLVDVVARLLGQIQEVGEDVSALPTGNEDLATSKQILRSRLGDLAEVCEAVLSGEVDAGGTVAWVSQIPDGPAYLNLAPLDVAAPIADELFEGKPVVLTSATLKIGGKFDVVASKVGFNFPSQGPWEGIDVGSPFTPEKQGVLYIAEHLAEPGKDGYGEDHLEEIVELVRASRGGALALFTSRTASERAGEYVRERLDLPVFVQGEDQLSTLVEKFAGDPAASLFGTLSLWQGVDVPGLTNRLVIIDRIPFPRPNDPLMQARKEHVDANRGNGFMQVAAAHAALLLAQGAGRLLRRIEDRGVVAILDPRLVKKRYGSYLMASIPRMWYTADHDVVCGVLGRLAQAAHDAGGGSDER
ncbi:ATP-dependent DNA helicase DinG [Arcanobacterium wilhelmae]|uniref:ATP-dependent DNA helicase DinG n=1 Tax=Arcanobacterium wilhelmae TaxID=1803177 RepID=A0ABT9N9R9_9ACTO|nr:ATP-dependent DNA helicase [Arcanobacterium wilhelmae]MDP9800268.1 ATP-dependent DNA helicase DinG [Arcanobacterium wilhelmae]WFN89707.1 ATP-dependent DNA helicase [Arcanobacterium wilhelmae]